MSSANCQLIRDPLQPRWNKYIRNSPTPKQAAFCLLDSVNEVFFGGAAGGGKAQPLDSLVCTPFGFRAMGDMKVGSVITCPATGGPQRVVLVTDRGIQPVYRVHLYDGSVCEVAGDHLWKYTLSSQKFGWRIATTEQIKEKLDKEYCHVLIPIAAPVTYTKSYKCVSSVLSIDPYLLGVLLGDGSLTNKGRGPVRVTTEDEYIKDYVLTCLGEGAVKEYTKKGSTIYDLQFRKRSGIYEKLEKMGLLGTDSSSKFIPEAYKYASIEYRQALLQGLMDTDGTALETGRAEYYTISEQLAKDVKSVVESLGGRARINKKGAGYKKVNGEWKECQDVYTVHIQIKDKSSLFRLKRKRDRALGKAFNGGSSEIKRKIVKIEYIGEKACRCITVDHPDGLYLTNDHIVTHNSDALLMAALQYVDVPGYNAILLRNQYTNLIKPEGLLSRATEWLTPHKEVRWNRDKKAFIFPSGATLSFGHLEGPMDHFAYQGPAYQFVGFDEVVQIREEQAMYLFSRMRKLAGRNVPLRFRSASNPPTRDQIATGKWVKERYVDEETRREGTIFIPANLNDNPYLDKESYLESLEKLDPITRRQLRDGDWNVSAKGNLFDRGMFEIVEAVPAEGLACRWWDLAATEEKFTRGGKPTKDPDYTVGAKIVSYKGLFYIVDIRRVQWAPPKVENLVKTTAILDGRSCRIRMEQEPGSSGVAVISSYMRMLAGYNFRGVPSTGSKADYATPLSVQADAGNVKILKAHWNEQLLEEFELFPYNGVKDDQVDACSKAFAELALRPKRAGAF